MSPLNKNKTVVVLFRLYQLNVAKRNCYETKHGFENGSFVFHDFTLKANIHKNQFWFKKSITFSKSPCLKRTATSKGVFSK